MYGGVNILTGDLLRGHSDAIILSLLAKGDNYGYQLNVLVNEITNGNFSFTEATMYTRLKGLENKEYIISYWQDGINVKRKYYSITEKGRKYLDELRNSWVNAKKIINKFMEVKND